jgi:phosphoglycerate kinase
MEAVTAITSELAAPAYDIHSLDTKGKVVLLRADLNVPVVHGRVTDVSRISAVLGTIKLLLDKGSRVAVISHFGRPDPSKQSLDEMRKRFSLKDVAAALAQLLPAGSFAGMAADCIGPDAQDMISSLKPGQVRYWGLHSQYAAGTTSCRMHTMPACLPCLPLA